MKRESDGVLSEGKFEIHTDLEQGHEEIPPVVAYGIKVFHMDTGGVGAVETQPVKHVHIVLTLRATVMLPWLYYFHASYSLIPTAPGPPLQNHT